jgi:hypothetical protein
MKEEPLVVSLTPGMMRRNPWNYLIKPDPPPIEEGKVVQFDAFARALEKQQVDLPADVAKGIEDNFWELL